jgi:hypothetical protein
MCYMSRRRENTENQPTYGGRRLRGGRVNQHSLPSIVPETKNTRGPIDVESLAEIIRNSTPKGRSHSKRRGSRSY